MKPTALRLRLGEAEGPGLWIDLTAGTSLAVPLDFEGAQPRHFDAPPARSTPYVVGDFNGEVARGASCNCRSVTLVPHCNGTHTEGPGHLTVDCPPLHASLPSQPLPALLLSLAPQRAEACDEDSLPTPQPGDQVLTRAALRQAWPAQLPCAPQVLVLRTLPNDPGKRQRDHSGANPPYLTRQFAAELVARGIEHLVIDLPSIDRSHDQGKLTAHRVFFGLPAGAQQFAQAARPQATVTELAFIDDALVDGPGALQLQVPAWSGDALPSRPLWFAAVPA